MQTYNIKPMQWEGWKNYETWATCLWLENEEWTYKEVLSLRRGADKYEYAHRIKSFTEEVLLEHNLKGLAGDLLDYAISQIDWIELAETWIENYFEEDVEEEEEDDE